MGSLSHERQEALAIVGHFTAFLSLLGSSWILYEIIKDRVKWKRTYHRLLFVMSFFDLLTSIAMGLSAIPIPQGTDNVYYGFGNNRTCSAQGFFIHLSIIGPFYNACLSIYYVLRVRRGMREKEIHKYVEPYMHLICNVTAWTIAFVALYMGMYNNATLWCSINDSPSNCQGGRGEEGPVPCEKGYNAWIFRWAFYYGPLWLTLMIVPAMMVLLYDSVRRQELKNAEYNLEAMAKKFSTRTLIYAVETKRKTEWSKKIASQALFYTIVFYLTFIFATLNRLCQLIMNKDFFVLLLLHIIFAPLQGFFNFLVYMRPRFLDWYYARNKNNPKQQRKVYSLDQAPTHHHHHSRQKRNNKTTKRINVTTVSTVSTKEHRQDSDAELGISNSTHTRGDEYYDEDQSNRGNNNNNNNSGRYEYRSSAFYDTADYDCTSLRKNPFFDTSIRSTSSRSMRNANISSRSFRNENNSREDNDDFASTYRSILGTIDEIASGVTDLPSGVVKEISNELSVPFNNADNNPDNTVALEQAVKEYVIKEISRELAVSFSDDDNDSSGSKDENNDSSEDEENDKEHDNNRRLSAKEQSPKEQSPKEQSLKEQSPKEQSLKELSPKEQDNRRLSAKRLSTKRLSTKRLSAKRLSAKRLSSKELDNDRRLSAKLEVLIKEEKETRRRSSTLQAVKELSKRLSERFEDDDSSSISDGSSDCDNENDVDVEVKTITIQRTSNAFMKRDENIIFESDEGDDSEISY